VGLGEKLDDLQDFNAKDFADALFETETDFEYNYERLDDNEEEPNTEEPDEQEQDISETAEPIVEEEEFDKEELAEAEPEEEVAEEKTDEKKSGKFGWLFKEIKFGKGKNKDNNENEQ